MWVDDASGEVESGVLQGQQPNCILSACNLHVPWLHVSAEEGTGPSQEGIYQLPAGCECGCAEAHAEGGKGLAHSPSVVGNTRRTGAAIQSQDTRLVELLRGILSFGDAQALSIYRREAYAVGHVQVQDTVASQDAQCSL